MFFFEYTEIEEIDMFINLGGKAVRVIVTGGLREITKERYLFPYGNVNG